MLGGPHGLGRCLIHESQDFASVGQHDIRINAINIIYICHQCDLSVIYTVVKHIHTFKLTELYSTLHITHASHNYVVEEYAKDIYSCRNEKHISLRSLVLKE